MKIAILDTGISSEHPDVSGTVNGNPKVAFVKSEANPAQFPSACDDGGPEDQVGHGTWTSSLAAGNIGGGLVIGVAPEAQIMNIKVLQRVPSEDPLPPGFADNTLNRCLFGGGSGLFSWTLEGMVDAVAHRADVISMSLGGFFPRTAQGQTRLWSSFNRVANFVNSHGAIVFAGAGNAGLDLGRIRSYVDLPAQASNIIAVMATTNPDCVENLNPNATCATGPDGLAFYSDFGSNLHGLSAPGGSLPAFGAPFPTGYVRGACSPGKPGTVDGLPAPGFSFGCFSFFAANGNPETHRWYVQAIGTSAPQPRSQLAWQL